MNKQTSVDLSVPLAIGTAAQAAGTSRKKGSPIMGQLAAQYQGLTDDVKAQWNFANNTLQTAKNSKDNAHAGTNGWSLFYSCNASLTAADQPLTLTPQTINVPTPLPPIRVQIAILNNTPVITLLPFTTTPYAPGPTIALWATIAVAQGNATTSTEFKGRAFRRIGQITGGLPLAGVNIAPQYLSVFPSIPTSCKIGFKLMAYNPGGYHTAKTFAVGLTPMLALEQTGFAEDNLHLAMGE